MFVMPCALSTDDIARISTTSLCRGVSLACRAALALPRHTAHLKSLTSKRENARENEKKSAGRLPRLVVRGSLSVHSVEIRKLPWFQGIPDYTVTESRVGL